MVLTHAPDDLARTATEITYNQNQTIYFDGEPAGHCYRVVRGVARICKETEDGRRQIAAFPSPGDLFGWTAGRCQIHSAEAASNLTLLRWPRQLIETKIINDLETEHRLLSILFEQLGEMQNHLLLLGRMPASARVASFLLSRAERHERNGMSSGRLPLPLCRRDIGDHLGLAVETVSRTMNIFKRRELIDFVLGQSVTIRDRHRLQKIAEGLIE